MAVVIKNSLILLFAVSLLLLVGTVAFAANPFGSVRVDVPSHSYKIPKKYFFESRLFRYFENVGGMDDSTQSVSLVFSSEEVMSNIPNFQSHIPESSPFVAGKLVNIELVVIVSGFDQKNMEYINSRIHHKDLWLGEGIYSEEQGGRIIRYDEETELYRIYLRDIKGMWNFVSIDPQSVDNEIPKHNANIAGCRDRKLWKTKGYSCLFSPVRGNVGLKYSLTETNFKQYPEIDDFIFNKLAEWEIKEDTKK